MKKIILILIAVLMTVFVGCTNNSFGSGKAMDDSAADPLQGDSGLSEAEIADLNRYVEIFAAIFDKPFDSPLALDQSTIGWFSFWRIYEDNSLIENDQGFCMISKDDLISYVRIHFGIDNYSYPGDLPLYDAEKGGYLFYPIGEGSLNDIQIENIQYGDDAAIEYLINITTNPMSYEASATKSSKTLHYVFNVVSMDGVCYLQAVSAR